MTPALTERGFTGHEHLDKFGLINMNGRLYDPVLGRFLNADPVIQFHWFTQSFNSYSYVLNNPLIFVDPSGYSASEATDYPDPYYAYQQWTKIHGYGLSYADFAAQFWDNIYEQVADGRLISGWYGNTLISMSFEWTETINNNYWIKGWDGKHNIGELVCRPYTYVNRIATMQVSSSNASSGGGYTINMQRIAESPNATVSEFTAYGPSPLKPVTGYILEPGGPSTTTANQDKRIPAGIYSVDPYTSKKYYNHYIVSNSSVSQDRRILIHSGNYHSHTLGCLLPGSSYSMVSGNYAVWNSGATLNSLRSLFSGNGVTLNIYDINTTPIFIFFNW